MGNADLNLPPALDDEAKLERLNAKLAEAIASLDRGEGIEVTDLGAYFDGVVKRVRDH